MLEKKAVLDKLVKEIIAERRRDPNEDHKDLLGLMTNATEEDGQGNISDLFVA
jgi:cytochrome P450